MPRLKTPRLVTGTRIAVASEPSDISKERIMLTTFDQARFLSADKALASALLVRPLTHSFPPQEHFIKTW